MQLNKDLQSEITPKNILMIGSTGVGKTEIKPVYSDGAFVPRKMLPYTLSYDHRAVNGVDGGQFVTLLSKLLADVRHLAL